MNSPDEIINIDKELLPIINMGKKLLPLMNSKQWLKAVIFQGMRLLERSDETWNILTEMHPEDTYNESMNQLKTFNEAMELVKIEEYFFIVSANKARVWLEESGKVHPEIQPYADQFKAHVPYIKEVRNMREHEIEYFNNNGRQQKNFVRDVGPPGRARADATSTFIDGKKYLIGGRLNVQIAISTAEDIHPKVSECLLKVQTNAPDLKNNFK